MKWNPPSERVMLVLLSPLIVPATAFLFIGLLPILAVSWLQDRFDHNRGQWRQWFAWRPVYCDGFWYDQRSKWVWLETIERRGFWLDNSEYRLKGWSSIYQGKA